MSRYNALWDTAENFDAFIAAPLTPGRAKAAVDMVSFIGDGDEGSPSEGHEAEDALHRRVLQQVADADLGDLSVVAATALETWEMDFSRWYA